MRSAVVFVFLFSLVLSPGTGRVEANETISFGDAKTLVKITAERSSLPVAKVAGRGYEALSGSSLGGNPDYDLFHTRMHRVVEYQSPSGIPGVASLMLERIHAPQSRSVWTSFGPGVFMTYDTKLYLFDDAANSGNNPTILYVDACQAWTRELVDDPAGAGSTDGIYTDEVHESIKELRLLDSGGSLTSNISIAATAELTLHSGIIFRFEIKDFDGSGGKVSGRLIELEDRRGYKTTITYLHSAPSGGSDEVQWQIDTVTDASGLQLKFSYHSTTKSGLWAISKIVLPSVDGSTIRDIDYVYTGASGNKQLHSITYPEGSVATITNGGAVNSTTNTWDISFEEVLGDAKYRKEKFFLTHDYKSLAEPADDVDSDLIDSVEIVSQPAGVVRMIADGNLKPTYISVPEEDSGGNPTSVRLIYLGSNRLMREDAFVSNQFYSSWTLSNPSNGFDGFTSLVGESTFKMVTDIGGGTVSAALLLKGTPPRIIDEFGSEFTYSYADSFVVEKNYTADSPGLATKEEWSYNANKQVTKYIDRLGRQTGGDYESFGELSSSVEGELSDGIGGVTGSLSDDSEFTYEYYAAGLANEYLLKRVKNPEFDSTMVGNDVVYEYDSGHRVTRIVANDFAGAGTFARNYSYDDAGRMVTGFDGETSSIVTYKYDSLDRLIEKKYFDNSTKQTVYGTSGNDLGMVVKRKNRIGVVSTLAHDASRRLTTYRPAYANDPDILDGTTGQVLVASISTNIPVTATYLEGTSLIESLVVAGKKRSMTYDYRHRLVEHTAEVARVASTNIAKRLSRTKEYIDNLLFSEEDPYGRRTFYTYRSSDAEMIRRMRETVPPSVSGSYNPSYSGFSSIDALTRVASANANYVLEDFTKNAVGEIVTYKNPRGYDQTFVYDEQGRLVETVEASGTSVAAKTEIDYDRNSFVTERRFPRYFDSNDSLGYNTAKTRYEPDGIGRLKTVFRNLDSTTEYDTTFERDGIGLVRAIKSYLGSPNSPSFPYAFRNIYRNAVNHITGSGFPGYKGMYYGRDAEGRVAHQGWTAAAGTDLHQTTLLDQHKRTEKTIKLDELNRKVAFTDWLTAPGAVDLLDVQIAGLDGVDEADGVTTRYFFDEDLGDDVGLDAASGMSVDLLNDGSSPGTYNLSISKVLDRLADTEANGGADLTFESGESSGRAIVVMNGEDEVAVMIFDSLGRIVCNAFIKPHNVTGTNDILASQCRSYDSIVSVSGGEQCVEVRTINPFGRISRVRSDGLGRAIEIVDQQSKVTSFEYDANTNQTRVRDPNSVGTDCTYDARDRKISSTDTSGSSISYAYDLAGNVVESTDSKSKKVEREYDALNRLTKIVDRLGGETTFLYDGHDNVIRTDDADGKLTTYEYDVDDQLVRSSDGATTSYYTYHESGLLESVQDELTHYKSFVWDFAGRLEKVEYRDIPSVSAPIIDERLFKYDAANRLVEAETTRYANKVFFQFDDVGRKTSERLRINLKDYETLASYDAANRKRKTTYPNGKIAEYSYFIDNVLKQVKYDGSVVENRTYDAGNRLKTCALGNGLTTTFSYLSDNRISSIANSTVGDLDYTYDANKNVLTEDITGPLAGYGFTAGTSFNDEDRLTGWQRDDGGRDLSWVLSDVGDWESQTIDDGGGGVTTDRTHGVFHEIKTLKVGLTTTTLTHDVKGNLTEDQDGRDLVWDDDNQLLSVDLDSDGTVDVEFEYDALGRRVRKTDGSSDTVYAYFGPQVMAEYDFNALASLPNEQFVYGSYVDEPILKDGTGDPAITTDNLLFYHRNKQFSVVALSNSNGSVVERYAYDPHGNTLVFDGSGIVQTSTQFENDYLFTGRRFDRETGNYYFRARYFDPELGRFISRDPAGFVDGMSLYDGYFVPNGVDPTGLDDEFFDGLLRRRLPSESRGEWISGTPGNGRFAFNEASLPVVEYRNGVPNFSDWVWRSSENVQGNVWIDYASTGNRRNKDNIAAVEQMRELLGDDDWETPDKYTWHHQYVDPKTGRGQMVLVKSTVHDAASHTGAFALWTKSIASKGDSTMLSKLGAVGRKMGAIGKKAAGPAAVLFTIQLAAEGYAEDGVSGAANAVGRDVVMADQVEWMIVESVKASTGKAQAWIRKGASDRKRDAQSTAGLALDPNAPIRIGGRSIGR